MKPEIQENIFWGYKPKNNGSYCNINMDTGMINYVSPESPVAPNSWIKGYKISEAMKKYFQLDDMVKDTINEFAKYNIDLFNRFINEL